MTALPHVDAAYGKITKYSNMCQNILCLRLVLDPVTYFDSIEVEEPVDA